MASSETCLTRRRLPSGVVKAHTIPVPRAEQGRSLRTVVLDTVGSTLRRRAGGRTLEVSCGVSSRATPSPTEGARRPGGRAAGDGLFVLFREPRGPSTSQPTPPSLSGSSGSSMAGVHFGDAVHRGPPEGSSFTGARTIAGGSGEVIVTQTVCAPCVWGELAVRRAWGPRAQRSARHVAPVHAHGHQRRHRGTASPRGGGRHTQAGGGVSPAGGPTTTFLVGIVAALVASSFTTYLLTREEDRLPKPPSGINRVIRFDPGTGATTMMPYALPPAGGSGELAVGEGGVWAADVVVSHIDPDDGTLEATVGGIQQFSYLGGMAVTTGLDDVWVASASGLFRIDPADEEVLDVRPFGGNVSSLVPTSVAVGGDAVWVTKDDGTLVRIPARPACRSREPSLWEGFRATSSLSTAECGSQRVRRPHPGR